jgi:hypothetical protein
MEYKENVTICEQIYVSWEMIQTQDLWENPNNIIRWFSYNYIRPFIILYDLINVRYFLYYETCFPGSRNQCKSSNISIHGRESGSLFMGSIRILLSKKEEGKTHFIFLFVPK